MERSKEEWGSKLLFAAKCLLISYLLTGVLLVVLSFFVYKMGLGEKVVTMIITAIYVIATFIAGYLAGKKLQNKKFLWGLALGCAYFFVLLLLSLLVRDGGEGGQIDFWSTWMLCAAGGMLGGTLS
jgi:putative membrane protein (TIGR04086 family)